MDSFGELGAVRCFGTAEGVISDKADADDVHFEFCRYDMHVRKVGWVDRVGQAEHHPR